MSGREELQLFRAGDCIITNLAIQFPTSRRSTNTALHACAAHFFVRLILPIVAHLLPLSGHTQSQLSRLRDPSDHRLLPQWTTREILAPGLRCPTLAAHFVWEYVASGRSVYHGRIEQDANSANKTSTGDRWRRYDSRSLHSAQTKSRLSTRSKVTSFHNQIADGATAVWHGVKGFRNSPYGERRIGGT